MVDSDSTPLPVDTWSKEMRKAVMFLAQIAFAVIFLKILPVAIGLTSLLPLGKAINLEADKREVTLSNLWQ